MKKIRSPDLFKDQKGIALFIVLWVLVLLSVIAGEFSHGMRTAVNITRNFKEQTEAYYIARAGANAALAKLIRQETRPNRRVSVETAESAGTDEDWRVNSVIPPVPFGGGAFQVWIENESGKININGAEAPLLRIMLEGFDLNETAKAVIVDSILDWRDSDSFHRANGAEDDYYRALPNPYEARDAPFLSISELLLVRGITPEIYYGGLEEVVTVRSGDSGGGSNQIFGEGRRGRQNLNRINVNAASPLLLDALPGIGAELVRAIKSYRTEQDFTSIADFQNLAGPDVSAAAAPFVSFENTSFFTIRSTGMIRESAVKNKVEVLVEIDPGLERKYRIIRWIE